MMNATPATTKKTPAKTVKARKKPVKKTPEALSQAQALKDRIVKVLDDRKAEAITVIDLEGKSSIGDYMVVASGTSPRHVAALAGHVIDALEEAGIPSPGVEGMEQGDWVLVDAFSVVVHLFRPEVRELYHLEKMWAVPGGSDVIDV